METKQLNGYKIEFYSEEPFYHIHQLSGSTWWKIEVEQSNDGETDWFTCEEAMQREKYILYAGLVSEISEELTEKIVGKYSNPFGSNLYHNYKQEKQNVFNMPETAKQSFQTLSELPYCVITKQDI